nr:hypothetical protein [Tanacetum cinerariifolium]
VDTPMVIKPLDADLSGTLVDQTKYRSMVGALMYLTASRPDIVHATCYCAHYQGRPTEKHLKEHGMTSCDGIGTPMATKHLDADLSGTPVDQTKYRSKAQPTEKHLTAVKRIFRYLKDTIHMGLWYPKDTGFDLTAFSDSNHAGCLDSRKSTSGGIQFLGGDKILTDYGFHFDKIPMYCDSKATIAISCNHVQHSHTKYIDVRYYFIKEKVEKGIDELFFVETEYQLADLFTKALPVERFQYLVRRLDDVDSGPIFDKEPEQKKKRKGKDVEPSKKSSASNESSKGNTPPKASKADDAALKHGNPIWFKQPLRPPTPDLEWNKDKTINDGPEKTWFSDLVNAKNDPLTFEDLMATPIDFLKFALNRLKINKLTKAVLVGHVYKLLKGTCQSVIELEYNMEECYRALTDQLDWTNPKGTKERKFTVSITKTKATRYELEFIEDMIPSL